MKIFVLTGVVLALSVASPGAFAKPSSEDNALMEMKLLQPTVHLGCPAPKSLSNKNTPPDLFAAVSVCIQEGKYREGAFLFAMAGVYGRYDTLRVEDQVTHRAVELMRLQVTYDVGEEKYEHFLEAGLRKTLGEPKSLAQVCKALVKHGAPSYRPDYMLKFGEAQTVGTRSGLIKDFNSKEAFKSALVSYLRCPNL